MKGRLTFTSWRLLEATITPMPANVRSVVVAASLAPVTATSGLRTPAVTLPDEPLSIAAAIAGVQDMVFDRLPGQAGSEPTAAKVRRLRHLVAARQAGIGPREGFSSRTGTDFTIHVPEALLQAAVTTTTTAVGLNQEMSPLADLFARAAGPAALLGVLPRRMRGMGLQQFPRVVTGPVPSARPEGGFVQDANVGALGANVGAAATAITLAANATSTVRVGDYLQVNAEYLKVTAVTNQAAFTVARGQAGSVAVAHVATDAVILIQTLYIIDHVATSPKRFSTLFQVTVEGAVGFGDVDNMETALASLVESDFLPLMSAEMNLDLWTGAGAGGKVNGLANRVTAGNTTTYADAATAQDLLDAMYEMVFTADAADVPEDGRYFAMSPRFYRKLLVSELATTKELVTYDAMGRPRFWGVTAIKDTDIPESADTTDVGRCWFVSTPWLPVVRYGMNGEEAIELIFDRENGTGDWQITPIAMWDVAQRDDSVLQLLKEA